MTETENSESFHNYTLLEDPNFPPAVYESYSNLQKFARTFNTYLSPPEIVFLGQAGHGKTSLIEALVGVQLQNGPTKRVTYYHLLNNPSCQQPKCLIKGDPLSKDKDDKEIPLTSLPQELDARNNLNTNEPIHVFIEYVNQWTVLLIDTPAISFNKDSEETANRVRALITPTNRTILAVEETCDWENSVMIDFTKTIDPDLNRTIFVYNKFYNWLRDKSAANNSNRLRVNTFLNCTSVECPSFFLSLLSQESRGNNPAESFRKKLSLAYKRDIELLEQLQFDKERHKKKIGLYTFRRHILQLCKFQYQESIPKIIKDLRDKRLSNNKNIQHIQTQINSFQSTKLRLLASNYTTNFLQVIESLIQGTSEGNTFENGQTLIEEKEALIDGDWTVYEGQLVKVDPAEYKIPFWQSKLYGGQQFERLLFEFKSVIDHTEISPVTSDDVAIAFGNQYGNLPWAASNLARQKTKDAFAQPIEQVCYRAVQIMKRLVDIAEKMLENQSKKGHQRLKSSKGLNYDIENMDQYPYFRYHVKDLYNQYIDATAAKCLEKCMEEFYCANAIYWDITENSAALADAYLLDPVSEPKKIVTELASHLFKDLRKQLIKNTLLRLYNFFLHPIQEHLHKDILEKVNTLTDKELNGLFEVEATVTRYQQYVKQLSQEVQISTTQESEIFNLSNQFSHLVLVHTLGSLNF